MLAQSIIGTSFYSSGGGGGGQQTQNSFTMNSDDPSRNFANMTDWWYSSTTGGSAYALSTFSSPAPSWSVHTYTDASSGHVYDFTGSEYLMSPNLSMVGGTWASNTITIDYWFYPTAYGTQLLIEQNDATDNPQYHYSVLEIDGSGYIKAMFWSGSSGTSTNQVVLNQWNHIWFTEDTQGGHSFELNGVPTNGFPVYTRTKPTTEYFSIGRQTITNMGSSGRFQGKVGLLTIYDYVVSSTYSSGFKYISYPTPTSVDLTGQSISAGSVRRDYNQGYFNDDTTWFGSRSPTATSTPNSINIGAELDNAGIDYYSIQWTGYFVPPSTGNYTFRTTSDDASFFWIGADALTGYTPNNSAVNNGGLHGPYTAYSPIYHLTANTRYPIRAQYGEQGGGATMYAEYSKDNGATWTAMSNMVFVNTTTDGFKA